LWPNNGSPHSVNSSCCLSLIFATVNCFGCALLSITTGNAWWLFLEDREGWSHMSEAARNYGEEWSYNYELRRLGMHGSWGGSERRRVELLRGSTTFLFFGRACCGCKTSADCARRSQSCVARKWDLLIDRVFSWLQIFSLRQ
jgi:hypothetical protein